MPEKVLVTGASGYIASHVVQQLLTAGYEVRGTVRNVKDEVKVQHLSDLCPQAGANLKLVEADLLMEDSWLPAVDGMDYVIHTASPFPSSPPPPEEEGELLRAAVEGTLHILRACVQVPSVKRVVLTGSTSSINSSRSNTDQVHTEAEWSDEKDLDAYGKSKLRAEKAAWDFMKTLPDDRKLELVVINPGLVLGPPLHSTHGTSTGVVQRLLDRLIPAIPKLDMAVADVRDVAKAHILALTSSEAVGHRHIICTGNMWMSEMANLLSSIFNSQGYNIPTLVAPNFALKVASKLDSSVRPILPFLGIVHKYDNTRMKKVLGVEPRDMRDTVVDMAHAMIQRGLATRSDKYAGPGGEGERTKYMALKLS